MKIPDLIDWLKVNADTKSIAHYDALLQAGDIIQRAHEWETMSHEQMRLHLGEMSAREILTVKAVIKNILMSPIYESHERRKRRERLHERKTNKR
jgi:hypothetical protein